MEWSELNAPQDSVAVLRGLLQECLDMSDDWPALPFAADLEVRIRAALATPSAPVGVEGIIAAARLIVDGAMPATNSGHTCFVPRYQIDKLKAALAATPAVSVGDASASNRGLSAANEPGIDARASNGNRPLPFDRDVLGRMVREAWVRWAQKQPNPKPSWLAPYDELDEADKEADRCIGETIARWTLIGDAAIASKGDSNAS